MFCEPVHRLRPRTTATVALTPAGNNHDMLIDASAAGSTLEDASIATREGLAQPAIVADATSPRSPAAGTTSGPSNGPQGIDRSLRSVRSSVAMTGSVGVAAAAAAAGRGGTTSGVPAVGRPSTVGPASFARAERPHVTDERRRREESYGKKVVRLLTPSGDVLMTVNRRRDSAWGDREYRGGSKTAVPGGSDAAAAAAATAAAITGGDAKRKASRGGGDVTRHTGGNPCIRRTKFGCPGGVQAPGAGRGSGSAPSLTTGTRPGWRALGRGNAKSSSTLEAQATSPLPGEPALSLPVYREPGRSELPAIFCATTAPMARAEAHRPPRNLSSLKRRGAGANPDGVGLAERDASGADEAATTRNGLDDGDGHAGSTRRRSEEEEERVARIVAEAEALVSGGGGGRHSGGRGSTRIPVPFCRPNAAAAMEEQEQGSSTREEGGRSCDIVSSTIWSEGESAAVDTKPTAS